MEATKDAGGAPLERGVGRLEPERASACGLTECQGKPMCPCCVRWKARDDGMPGDPAERHLRRLLAVRVGMPHTYYDDGEAQGQEHGIVIDFMREPVSDIDAKLRALNVARAELRAHQDNKTKPAMQRDCEQAADELERLSGCLLWLLWHHQGASSPTGQPIRRALGIDQHAPMTEAQIEAGRHMEELQAKVDAIASPWQPMKTAPKDGWGVLVLLEGSDMPLGARWLRGKDDPHATEATEGPGWHMTWDGSPVAAHDGPRYWMHCPGDPDA